MALFANRARFLPGTDRVALPALLVNNDFCAECFIRNIHRIGSMASGTGIGLLLDFFRFIVANLALDRGGFQIVRMGRTQFLGVDRMVALHALDPEILYVHLMMKYHFARGRRENPLRRYFCGISLGGQIDCKKDDC